MGNFMMRVSPQLKTVKSRKRLRLDVADEKVPQKDECGACRQEPHGQKGDPKVGEALRGPQDPGCAWGRPWRQGWDGQSGRNRTCDLTWQKDLADGIKLGS